MIITLITLALFTAGITLLLMKRKIKDYYTRTVVDGCGFLLAAIGFAVGLIVVPLLICNFVTYDLDYQNTLHKKEMLEYRIEHIEENITGNEMLYNDIVEFNNELRNTKKFANNLWTNLFSNKDIAAIDYIELNKYTENDHE